LNKATQYQEGYFEGTGKVKLFYRNWETAEPNAVVVRIHGFGSHSGRSKHIGQFLVERGFNFSSYDQRGHGKSEGMRGFVDTFQELLDDLHVFVELSKVESRPTFLLGSSFGGLVSLLFSIKNPNAIAGIIASAPFLKLGSAIILSSEDIDELQKLAISYPAAFFRFGRTNQVKSQPEKDELMYDTMSFKLFSEILKAQKTVFDCAHLITVPSLLLQGSADTIADPSGSVELFDKIVSPDKKLIMYKSMKHVLLGNNNETKRVLLDIVNWMHNHIKT
jgi:alpha-beta hydrolase superfamily lysophospholipase